MPAPTMQSQSCSIDFHSTKPRLQLVPSQSCRVEIASVFGIWKCMLECHDWSPTMFLFAYYKPCILWKPIFGEASIMTSGNFVEHIFVKCPPKRGFIWRPIWHLRLRYWTQPPCQTCLFGPVFLEACPFQPTWILKK